MEGFEKATTKSLLEHFSEVEDFRASWRVAYPMPEIHALQDRRMTVAEIREKIERDEV